MWKAAPCPSLVRKRTLSAAACWQLGPFILRPGSPRQGSRAALGPVVPGPPPAPTLPPMAEPPSILPAGSFVAEARQACFCSQAQAAPHPSSAFPPTPHSPVPPGRTGAALPAPSQAPLTAEDKSQGTTGKKSAHGYTRGLNAGLTGPPGFEAHHEAPRRRAGPPPWAGACHLPKLKIRAPFGGESV